VGYLVGRISRRRIEGEDEEDEDEVFMTEEKSSL